MGHLQQTRQNILSSKPKQQNLTQQPLHLCQPPSTAYNVTSVVYDPTETSSSDQTGKFPITSSRGNKYIMVFYHHDTNCILAEPMKSRGKSDLTNDFSTLYSLLSSKGYPIKIHFLDNEAPNMLLEFFLHKGVKHHFVPPYTHRVNKAERAIQTFKAHFISGISSLPSSFPMHLWCTLLPQATISLNILRSSKLNKTISAHHMLHGQFDYMSTPMAPPGSPIMIHQKSEQRTSWGPRALPGWYIGPAMHHYRCFQVYQCNTGHIRTSDTVVFLEQNSPRNLPSSRSILLDAATTLTGALSNPTSYGEEQVAALQTLATIFKQSASQFTPSKAARPQRVDIQNKPLGDNASLQRVVNVDTTKTRPTYSARIQPSRKAKQPLHYSNTIAHINSIVCPKTNNDLEYRALIKGPTSHIWERSFANELARLADGLPSLGITGTNSIEFIPLTNIPSNKTITYGRIVVEYKPNKLEKHRTRLTEGGDRITYTDPKNTPTAELPIIKLLLNSVISTPNARFITADISNFYLNTKLTSPEYMQIPLHIIPDSIVDHYKLQSISHNNKVYIKIINGMYGLPQAGMLAYLDLCQHLKKFQFFASKLTPGLWTHQHRPISFSLVVDDFGIKYTNVDDAHFLLNALQKKYKITTDWSGSKYCGLTLNWNYNKHEVTISLPNYIPSLLKSLEFIPSSKPAHSPSKYKPPVFTSHPQLTEAPDNSNLLNDTQTKYIQKAVGSLMFYSRATDSTQLLPLGDVASSQSKPTQWTMDTLLHLLQYAATHPTAPIKFKRSDMVLRVHSDASYLSDPKARSREGGFSS
jgi:hypothetical protein